MKTASQEVVASFYYQARLCYASTYVDTEAPWVHDFDDVPTGAELCVVASADNDNPNGLYVRKGTTSQVRWVLAVEMDELVKNCSATLSRITVVLDNTSTGTVPSTATRLYRNGQSLPTSTPLYATKFDVFAYIEPLALEASTSDSVNKKTPAASDNIIQVSDGATKDIKDWSPASAGIVKTDASGHPSIAVPGTDYALPTDLVPKNIPTGNPAATGGDPVIELKVGTSATRTINMAELTSGGGFKIGMVVTNAA